MLVVNSEELNIAMNLQLFCDKYKYIAEIINMIKLYPCISFGKNSKNRTFYWTENIIFEDKF